MEMWNLSRKQFSGRDLYPAGSRTLSVNLIRERNDFGLGSMSNKTSDFDVQMSAIKFWNGDENKRSVYKKSYNETLSGCLHFGLFNSQKVHSDLTFSLNRSNGVSKNLSFYTD
jgi:hypothetical protein